MQRTGFRDSSAFFKSMQSMATTQEISQTTKLRPQGGLYPPLPLTASGCVKPGLDVEPRQSPTVVQFHLRLHPPRTLRLDLKAIKTTR